MSILRSLAFLVLALPAAAVTACSTIDEGGTSTSAGSGPFVGAGGEGTDQGEGVDETGDGMGLGPEDFDSCFPGPEGTHALMGWHVTCTATSAVRSFVNPLDSTFVEIEDFSGPFGTICCGGIASDVEADADCQALCLAQICEAARTQHVAWAVDVSNDGMGGDCLDVTANCGFDLELCMTGDYHEQHGQPGMLFSYIMRAECEAAHDQVISPWGTMGNYWDWVELPNDPSNDPAICAPISEPEPGPPERSPENEMEEEPGTSVTLRWSLDGGPVLREQSLDVDVDLAYSVAPCAAGDCLGLSRLHVTIPDGTHHGLKLRNMHLLVEQLAPQTPLSASGAFSFGSGALRATLSLAVDEVPLVITGNNEGRVAGVVLPRAGMATLTNLVFAFDEGIVDAALELNINGTYVRRAPDALIKVVESPTACAMPVTFEAASTDLDGEPLNHLWWVPPWFLGTGNLLDATLPPGSYRVYLTSFDPTGRFDSVALEHVRSCQ